MLVVLLGAGVAALLLYGGSRWRAGTATLRQRLEGARVAVRPATYDPAVLDGLPAPVQRYFRAVLRPGQPMVAGARLSHRGTFNRAESGERWVPFTSDQRVVTRRPGFDWDARVAMMPGVAAWVHDAYVEGEGLLHAAMLGVVPVMSRRGTPELARGELMRFLAEAAWYPTALLPGQGVRWDAVDERSARATLADGAVEVALVFRFDDTGLIESVAADARERLVGGRAIPTPWLGRWSAWQERDGMRIPLEGEVSWLPPGGELPYWRGRITRIAYEFAR